MSMEATLRPRRWHLLLLALLVVGAYVFLEQRYVAERRELVLQQDDIAQALTHAYLDDHGPIFLHDGALYAGRYRINWSDTLVDAVKADSGCGATIFQGDEQIATTATPARGSQERAIGSHANPEIKRLVWEEGKSYRGAIETLGQSWLIVYKPLNDAEGTRVGMIATWRERDALSRELLYFRLLLGGAMTLLFGTVVLMMLSVERNERGIQRARRKLVEERAKLQAQFFESMSQELRTPLAAILVFAQTLLDALKDDKSEAVAKRIHAETKDVLRSVDDIHDYSRIEAKSLKLEVAEVDLKAAIAKCEERGREMIGARGLKLRTEVPEDLPAVNGDPARVQQVLTNLLANAIRSTVEGRVALKARADRDAVLVDVSDTGGGLSEEALNTVWDPFRKNEAMAAGQASAGLALAIARGLAQAMGGDVTVASKPGKGTTFTLRLPRASITV